MTVEGKIPGIELDAITALMRSGNVSSKMVRVPTEKRNMVRSACFKEENEKVPSSRHIFNRRFSSRLFFEKLESCSMKRLFMLLHRIVRKERPLPFPHPLNSSFHVWQILMVVFRFFFIFFFSVNFFLFLIEKCASPSQRINFISVVLKFIIQMNPTDHSKSRKCLEMKTIASLQSYFPSLSFVIN